MITHTGNLPQVHQLCCTGGDWKHTHPPDDFVELADRVTGAFFVFVVVYTIHELDDMPWIACNPTDLALELPDQHLWHHLPRLV